MGIWLLGGLALLGLVFFLAGWYANTSVHQAGRALKVLLWLGVAILFVLIATRTSLFALIGSALALLPLLSALRGARNRSRAKAGPSPGGASTVRADWLEMTLDHDTGDMSGVVLKGRFADASLDDLGREDLDAFAGECREDANSARLLAEYMQRRFGEAPGGRQTGASPAGAMEPHEALAILGLEEGADVEAIESAYRALMKRAHPDHGGNAYWAARLNEAREVLLACQ